MHAINGVEVVLEVPHDVEADIEKLIVRASNGDFGISFLAPDNQNNGAAWDLYMDRLAIAARHIAQKKNIPGGQKTFYRDG